MQDNRAITSVFSPKWYIEQMKGWTTSSYALLMFGLGFLLAATISAGHITPVAILTMLAGMLGFTCTISITNTKPLNGIFGIISALIYIVVAFNAKNYNDMLLQTVYIIVLDIPVLLMPDWAKNVDQKVRGLATKGRGFRNWLLTVAFFLISTGLLYIWESQMTDSPRPLIDSVAAAIGFTGALLTTLRFRESYYCWLIQSVMSITLWGITALQGGSNWVLFFTYILYLTNDLVSLFDKNVVWFHQKKTSVEIR